ncbi:hypothetical protein SBF1_1870012 [Candidatus Desulfosporosinus infrequens]|uniref:Uncharacterized protein n=1 Tax=Candidatus Desulfosporosinus infrequens TaxID=2043169 RepID=A0A2U3KDL0_9FIRM|nr:hypothetical protein SBF1_1870012 [Candidatus Desulfosporosinus infrequens]
MEERGNKNERASWGRFFIASTYELIDRKNPLARRGSEEEDRTNEKTICEPLN